MAWLVRLPLGVPGSHHPNSLLVPENTQLEILSLGQLVSWSPAYHPCQVLAESRVTFSWTHGPHQPCPEFLSDLAMGFRRNSHFPCVAHRHLSPSMPRSGRCVPALLRKAGRTWTGSGCPKPSHRNHLPRDAVPTCSSELTDSIPLHIRNTQVCCTELT